MSERGDFFESGSAPSKKKASRADFFATGDTNLADDSTPSTPQTKADEPVSTFHGRGYVAPETMAKMRNADIVADINNIPAGFNRGVTALAGLPVDTAANIMDVGGMTYGAARSLLQQGDLGASEEFYTPSDRSQDVGSGDWFSQKLDALTSALGGNSATAPTSDTGVGRVLYNAAAGVPSSIAGGGPGILAGAAGGGASAVAGELGADPATQAAVSLLAGHAATRTISPQTSPLEPIAATPDEIPGRSSGLERENSTFGRDSASAASAVPDVAKVSPQLRQEIMKEHAAGTLDRESAARAIDADTLPIPVKLTEGEVRNDADAISREQNSRGKDPERVKFYQDRNDALIDNINNMRREAAPNVMGRDSLQHGQQMIDSYKAVDAPAVADIDAKYQALRDAAGGDFPIDTGSLSNGIAQDLKKELLTSHFKNEMGSLREPLEEFAQSGKMTFDEWMALRRNAGTIARSSKDGLTRTAAGIVVENLEKIPMTGVAADLKPMADAARSAAKARFDRIKADPAYRAAVEDGVDMGEASPEADKFAQKYIIGGKAANLQKMRANLANDQTANETINAVALDHLADRAGVNGGKLTQHGYNNALRDLLPKAKFLMPQQTQELAEQIGRVAHNTLFQPSGNYISKSDTATALIAEHAKNAAEGVINVKFGGLPVGTGVRKFFDKRSARKEWERATAPGAGLTRLSDLTKVGKKK